MAIIQSILVGKGRGKIGNVVLSGLKGQTVAKQLNSSPSNPRTVAQTANRVKMANAVLAWQFLANFMSNAKGLRKPLESVYNAFVRNVVSAMADVLAGSRAEAAASALAVQRLSGNWFTIGLTSGVSSAITAEFNPAGVPWASSFRVVAMYFDSSSGDQSVVEKEVTEVDYNAGSVTVDTGVPGIDKAAALYIYDSASSKITNIAFYEV